MDPNLTICRIISIKFTNFIGSTHFAQFDQLSDSYITHNHEASVSDITECIPRTAEVLKYWFEFRSDTWNI